MLLFSPTFAASAAAAVVAAVGAAAATEAAAKSQKVKRSSPFPPTPHPFPQAPSTSELTAGK